MGEWKRQCNFVDDNGARLNWEQAKEVRSEGGREVRRCREVKVEVAAAAEAEIRLYSRRE